jgi:hypothetical protein
MVGHSDSVLGHRGPSVPTRARFSWNDDYNRKLLRRNGLGVFTGAFELDLEDKQNAIDESRKKTREWMALMSPEIWLGE